MKLLIGVPTMGFSRNDSFYDYLEGMMKPEGTLVTKTHGQSPAKGRNLIIQEALKNDCTHLLFIDDDMAIPHDALMKLLNHDVDIVSGLYLMRNYPHRPVMFGTVLPNGKCIWRFLYKGEKGLVEVVAAGLGFCLFKIEVFKKIPGPYWVTLGELEADGWCDDIALFKRVREAGFKIHVDLSCPIGHMFNGIVWPNKQNGEWITSYDTGGEGIVSMPCACEMVSV